MTTQDFMDMAESILTPDLVQYKVDKLHMLGWVSLWVLAIAAAITIVAAIILIRSKYKAKKAGTELTKGDNHYRAWWVLGAGLVLFAVALVIYCIVLYETFEWIDDPIRHIYLNLKDWL